MIRTYSNFILPHSNLLQAQSSSLRGKRTLPWPTRLMSVCVGARSSAEVYVVRRTIDVPVAAFKTNFGFDRTRSRNTTLPLSSYQKSSYDAEHRDARMITAEDKSRVRVQCDMAAVGVDWRNRSLFRSQSFQVQQGCQNSAKSHHA